MPQLPSAKLRRRRAGELMRRILLDMIVATRPQRTLFHAFLDAKKTFGSHYRLVEDIRMQEESYGSILKMSLGLARILLPMTREEENVGVMTPNAAPTLGLILGLSAIKRVPAMLNYTAGVDGIQAACTAAQITKIITSRAFVEKARLQPVVDRLSEIEVYYLEDLEEPLHMDRSALGDVALCVSTIRARIPRTFGVPPSCSLHRALKVNRRGWCIRTHRCSPMSPRFGRSRISRRSTNS